MLDHLAARPSVEGRAAANLYDIAIHDEGGLLLVGREQLRVYENRACLAG